MCEQDDQTVHSFQTLLADLATVTRNTVQLAGKQFDKITTPTPLQQKALTLWNPLYVLADDPKKKKCPEMISGTLNYFETAVLWRQQKTSRAIACAKGVYSYCRQYPAISTEWFAGRRSYPA
jgi:hypothetical protein